MDSNVKTVRAIVFDIRRARANDVKFISSAEALYEVSLLAHASTSSNFAYLTLVLVGVKGFELLLDLQPLIELEPSFKRAFAKLKQLMRISSQNAIYSSTRKSLDSILDDIILQFKTKSDDLGPTKLEIVVFTTTEEERFKNELDVFLLNTDCSQFNQLTVIHLAPSQEFLQDQLERWPHGKVVWLVLEDEGDAEFFFKSWLARKRKNWMLQISDVDGQCEWVTRIDIEDVLFDLNGWPDRISANFHEKNAIGFFHEGKEKTLEIVKWIMNDGVPAWLIHGMPRRVIPTEEMAGDEVGCQINVEHFSSLSLWLAKEGLVAIARLLPCKLVTDFFILSPGSDGSLLMRNIVSRELILPPSTTSSTVGDIDSETLTPKEVYYEEIQSAYLQLPTHSFSRAEESVVVKAIEKDCFKDTSLGAKPKTARSRKLLQ